MSRITARIVLVSVFAAAVGCATTRESNRPLVPTRHQTRTGPFVVFTNDPIGPEAPVVRQLQLLETDFTRTLGTEVPVVEQPIEIYLLTDRKAFEHFLTFYYPDLPHRRAFFLAQGDRRVIYTFVSEHVEVDIRHEATHALLSLSYGDLPLWLDEGIAEFFECPGESGRNPENLRRLAGDRGEGWKPDLAHLEQLREIKEMTPRDYREAWAWTHLLLTGNENQRRLIKTYLGERRDREQLAPRLRAEFPEEGELLIGHLDALEKPGPERNTAVAGSTVTPMPSVRLQNDLDEPPLRLGKGGKPKRGLFGRVRDLVLGKGPDER